MTKLSLGGAALMQIFDLVTGTIFNRRRTKSRCNEFKKFGEQTLARCRQQHAHRPYDPDQYENIWQWLNPDNP